MRDLGACDPRLGACGPASRRGAIGRSRPFGSPRLISWTFPGLGWAEAPPGAAGPGSASHRTVDAALATRGLAVRPRMGLGLRSVEALEVPILTMRWARRERANALDGDGNVPGQPSEPR